ncbi:hypothetical protein ACE6H2_019432 [Prunus campanulata]
MQLGCWLLFGMGGVGKFPGVCGGRGRKSIGVGVLVLCFKLRKNAQISGFIVLCSLVKLLILYVVTFFLLFWSYVLIVEIFILKTKLLKV